MDRLSALSFQRPPTPLFFIIASALYLVELVQLVARRKRKSNKASRLSRLCAAAAEFKPLTTLRRSSRHTAPADPCGSTYKASHCTKWHQAAQLACPSEEKRVASGSSPSPNPHKRRRPSIPRKYNSGSSRHLCVDHSTACCTYTVDRFLVNTVFASKRSKIRCMPSCRLQLNPFPA
ncbi:hypothetical protein J3F84DRAFT_60990 [Trichoderma pleuroticola]